MARELDDAILNLRTNYLDYGVWVLKTRGAAARVLATDAFLLEHRKHWFVREVIGQLRRTFARLDVSSRSLFALIEPDSCFAGIAARTRAGVGPHLHVEPGSPQRAAPC